MNVLCYYSVEVIWEGNQFLVPIHMNILMLFHQMMYVGHALHVVINVCRYVTVMCCLMSRIVEMRWENGSWMMMEREEEIQRVEDMYLIFYIGVHIVDMIGHYATCFYNTNI